MKVLDLDIVKINYDLADEKVILELGKKLIPTLEVLKQGLYPYKKVNVTLFINGIKNAQVFSESNEIVKKAFYVLTTILRENINVCYEPLVPEIADILLKYQLDYPISQWKEYLSKEIIYPNDDLSKVSQSALIKLQVAYLFLNGDIDLFSLLKYHKMEEKDFIFEAYSFMSYHFKKTRDHLKNPKDVSEFVWQNVKYGWKRTDGKVIDSVNSFWYKEYVIQSVEEVLENHYGCCVDISRVCAYLLKDLKYPNIVRLTKHYKMFHAYTIYIDKIDWYRMDLLSCLNPAILKIGTPLIDKQINYTENNDINNTRIYDLPSKIDHKRIEDVVNYLDSASGISRNKRLANKG